MKNMVKLMSRTKR